MLPANGRPNRESDPGAEHKPDEVAERGPHRISVDGVPVEEPNVGTDAVPNAGAEREPEFGAKREPELGTDVVSEYEEPNRVPKRNAEREPEQLPE